MRLKDIAREAGVSISTVSRVISNPSTNAASPEKRDLILKIAEEGGYLNHAVSIPDRPIAPGEPNMLYCMLAIDPLEYNGNPYFATLMSGLRLAARRYNCIVQYYFPTRSGSFVDFTPPAPDQSVQGLIIIGRFDPEILDSLKDVYKNVAYVGLNTLDADCDQIICEGSEAARAAVHYLYNKGHRRIGFLGSSDDRRFDGYKKALQELSLPLSEQAYLNDVVMSIDGGYQGMQQLIQKHNGGIPATAIFCASDTISIGALHACNENGIRVPEDVALIGLDDSEMTRYISPTLSSIHIPLEEMGQFAVKVLFDRIHDHHHAVIRTYFPFEIVERESTQIKA